jgi:hypothetical protein
MRGLEVKVNVNVNPNATNTQNALRDDQRPSRLHRKIAAACNLNPAL